jgi:WD40 repeat protein
MQAPSARITMRRLMIGAAVVVTILGAIGFLYWLWSPLVEPTKSVNHGMSTMRRALLRGTGEFLSWNPNAQILATSSTGFIDQDAILWESTTGKRQAVLPVGAPIYGLEWSPDGKTLVTGSWNRSATLWNAETGKPLMTLRGHTGKIYDVAWSPDGKTLATGADDNLVILWDTRSGQARSTLKGHSTRVVDVRWSPDGKTLASGSDGLTLLWDMASEQPRATLSGNLPRWSPDGRNLATVIGDTAILWDPSTATELAKLTGHTYGIWCLAWSPDGKILATGSGDAGGFWRGLIPDRILGPGSAAILWDATTLKARFLLTGHRHHIESLAWSPDGRNLATGSWDQSVIIWDVPTGTRTAILRQGFDEVIDNVAWSPDGKILATTFGSFQKSTILWNIVRTEAVKN